MYISIHRTTKGAGAIKEINIARVLVAKRKEKGITQEELAGHMGVSKASVSKWETGQSYPDVVLLPQLASFFNISLDELMDYQPQLSQEDVRRLYRTLAEDFTVKPFSEMMSICRDIIKKYYSCFSLLLQMGILLYNHVELAGDHAEAEQTVALAGELFCRVREESGEVSLTKQALYLEAACRLVQGNPDETLLLLEGSESMILPPEIILSMAYQTTGRERQARAVLQSGMYQTLVLLFNFLPATLSLCAKDPIRFDETLRRARAIAAVFDLEHLHPALLFALFLSAAQGYMAQGRHSEALDMLWEYTELATGSELYPLRLKGDDYFNLIDEWLEGLALGTQLPRNEKTVLLSMVHVVEQHPAFAPLKGEPRYQSCLDRLKGLLGP